MKKTAFFVLTLAFVIGLAADQALAQSKILKITTGLTEEHPVYLANKRFGEILAAKLPGKYTVQAYANAQLGDDVRATESVRMGTLEMVMTSSSPLTGLVPEFNVFDLPFIVPNEKGADAIFDGPVGAKLAAALEAKGLKLLAYYENGFRQLTNSAREVKSPADMKGLKIRTMQNPIHLEAFRAMGANPTPMPFSEVFTALQQKTIDGQENPIPTIWLSKFYEVQKYITLTGHVYGPQIMLINKKLWESFPAADQKIIAEAAKETAIYQRGLNRKLNTEFVNNLKKAGNTVTVLTPEQHNAFVGSVASVYATWEPKIGKALLDEFRATVNKAR